jgi:hypothetical protein
MRSSEFAQDPLLLIEANGRGDLGFSPKWLTSVTHERIFQTLQRAEFPGKEIRWSFAGPPPSHDNV